jgi:glycosyltransferase involved in cell wall biosynthesis
MDAHEALAPTELFFVSPPDAPMSWSRFLQCLKILLRRKPRTALRYWSAGPERSDEVSSRQHIADLKKRYQAWSPDLIYSNTAMNGDCIHALDLDAPVAVHVRELEDPLSKLAGVRLNSFLERTDCFIAASGAVQAYLIQAYGIAISRTRIAHAAIEDDAVRESAGRMTTENVQRELGITDDTLLVGGVGIVALRKGVDLFVDVAMSVIDSLKDEQSVAFVWIGGATEPELETEVNDRIRESGLETQVRLLGLKENPYPYLRRFDLLLMTSRNDPFPRVNLECGLLGIPVVAFAKSGGSAEFVGEDCGVLAEHLDIDDMAVKTVELLRDGSRRKTLGENAHQKVVAQYTIGAVGPVVMECIEELVSAKSLNQGEG